MEELIKSKEDLRLTRLEQAIHGIKDESGKIRTEKLDDALKNAFGSSSGGEYLIDHSSITGRGIGIPVLQKNAEYLAATSAVIYAPKKRKNVLLQAAKKYSKENSIPVAVSVGGKALARIPIQKMYIEIASELHNRLLDRFGDRVVLTAIVGGTGTRNVATIPTKVKPDRTGKLRPLVGTFPDLDFFTVVKGIRGEEKTEIQKMAREIERKIAKKYGFSENSYFVDVHRDYGIVDEKDVRGMAHSLHRLKPKIILHGQDFYENLKNQEEFQKHSEEEIRLYAEKLGILSSAVYVKTIANVWRQILAEIRDAENKMRGAKGLEKKEHHARKIIAEELEKSLQDVIARFEPLGMDLEDVIKEVEKKNMDRVVAETASRIYSYEKYGGKRMYLARKLANNDKETARILAIIEAASNLALERARQRIRELNSMAENPEDRILTSHMYRAAKAVQRRVLATALEDLIHAKVETGKNAQKDGYKHMPEKIYLFRP